jgi:zinc and cadmium transporter
VWGRIGTKRIDNPIMTFISILVGTLVAGMGSVWLAALLAYALLSRFTQHLLSLAAGALLATAFTRLLPEAFELSLEAGVSAHALFASLLVGLVFFFLLDKAELWHHGHEHGHGHHAHEHEHEHEHHEHAHEAHNHHSGGWAVLLGDSVHAFGDGILIAAAFVADPRLGVAAALAVMAHEVPHHVGDLVVLRQTLHNPRAALFKLSLAGGVTTIGGVVGYLLVGALHEYLPFFLVVAASSFIYVALADLIPQLQKRLSPRETAAQVAWLFAGIALVAALGEWAQH